MQKYIIFLFLFSIISCNSSDNFRDKTAGVVDPELATYVEQIKTWATEYGNDLFASRLQYVDFIIVDEFSSSIIDAQNTDLAITYVDLSEGNKGETRIEFIRSFWHSQASENEKIVLLLHEAYHAVSDTPSDKQHIDIRLATYDNYSIPASIMYPEITQMANSVPANWDKYSEYYLRQLFSMRLDRTWKE